MVSNWKLRAFKENNDEKHGANAKVYKNETLRSLTSPLTYLRIEDFFQRIRFYNMHIALLNFNNTLIAKF